MCSHLSVHKCTQYRAKFCTFSLCVNYDSARHSFPPFQFEFHLGLLPFLFKEYPVGSREAWSILVERNRQEVGTFQRQPPPLCNFTQESRSGTVSNVTKVHLHLLLVCAWMDVAGSKHSLATECHISSVPTSLKCPLQILAILLHCMRKFGFCFWRLFHITTLSLLSHSIFQFIALYFLFH